MLLHAPQQVEGLERRHIVQVGLVELVLEGRQERILKLEEGELEGTIAFDSAFTDVMGLDGALRAGMGLPVKPAMTVLAVIPDHPYVIPGLIGDLKIYFN